MRTTFDLTYTSTGDGGVTVEVVTPRGTLMMELDRQDVCGMTARLLAYSGVTEAEFSGNQMRVLS